MQIDFMTTFQKCLALFNLSLLRIESPFQKLENFDLGLRLKLDPQFDWDSFGNQLLKIQTPAVVILTEDFLGIHYASFSLSDESAVLIGPWQGEHQLLSLPPSLEEKLDSGTVTAIKAYFQAVPRVNEQMLIGNIIAFAESLSPDRSVRVEKMIDLPAFSLPHLQQKKNHSLSIEDFPSSLVQQRYNAENAFLDAVATGSIKQSIQAYQQFSRFDLGERFLGNLRSEKNGLIILNTLLRKRIEQTGVHPHYLDAISTRFSFKIEDLSSKEQVSPLQTEMLREYCIYVKKYANQSYSATIQTVIDHIHLNLNKPLTLKNLAELGFVSPSYLSNLFKQETGITLTNYIHTQRMQYAAYELRTTKKNITSISAEVGISDVNYFTKLFKKVFGCTPTQYRHLQTGSKS